MARPVEGAARLGATPLVCLCPQVLECSWDELWNRVQRAQDLDHIIAAHEAFLGTVISRCLLDSDSRVRHAPRGSVLGFLGRAYAAGGQAGRRAGV